MGRPLNELRYYRLEPKILNKLRNQCRQLRKIETDVIVDLVDFAVTVGLENFYNLKATAEANPEAL